MKVGAYVFTTEPDGDYKKFTFGIITGIKGDKVGVSGTIVNLVGLKNKVSQGKAGPRSIEVLQNPTPDNCAMSLIYRVESDNFSKVYDLNKEQILVIPSGTYHIIDGWIRQSLPELFNNVLSLPPGKERDLAKRTLNQRMNTLMDKNLKKHLYSICRSLKILF